MTFLWVVWNVFCLKLRSQRDHRVITMQSYALGQRFTVYKVLLGVGPGPPCRETAHAPLLVFLLCPTPVTLRLGMALSSLPRVLTFPTLVLPNTPTNCFPFNTLKLKRVCGAV